MKTRIVSLLMAFCMLFVIFSESAAPAMASTQAEIDKLKKQAAEITANKKDLQKEIDRLKAEAKDANAQKELLDKQNDMIRSELKNAEDQIANYERLIEQTKAELALAEQDEAEQHELFCRRVRAMEENGTVSYWAVLFNAGSFTDLLSTLDDVGEIMDNDQRIFDEMREIRKSIEEKKATLEKCLVEAEEQRNLLEEKRKELQAKLDESTALIQKISANKEQYQKLLKAEEAEAKSIDAQIKKLQAQLAASGSSKPGTKGGYIWPVTTSKKISSTFGSRVNPVTGRSETHKGVDIAGVFYSSNVIAAKAGTVIISQYGSSYGNYVVVSHGTGNTTLYAHLSKRSVKVGDVVKQGDVLGVTGSTGNSTGPHLHFEITEGGSRIDPLKYLTDYKKGWS